MAITKQVVLDEKALEAFEKLKMDFPFVSDSHLLRAALFVASRVDIDEFRKACEITNRRIGRPKVKQQQGLV